ncbi:MAG: acetylornithine/succinylornithine family transaminase [Clostridia bacterium]|nr:acetylornithine/succinylornithine family transaminase [Clostridia bacterium]
MNLFEKDKQYIMNTYGRFPLNIVKGKGSFCYDEKGKKYIDLGTGIAVNTFGFCDKKWVKAVKKQVNLFQHTSNLYYQKPCVDLAENLCLKTGAKKVFFSNSGAEANECAIKIARKYAELKKGKEYYNILTLKNSFHGRTITTLSATGQEVFHKDFTPLTQGFIHTEANDIEMAKSLLESNKIAGVLVEVVQGEGGVMPLKKEFVQFLREYTKKNDILFMIDEVQTGNGRTGELYGYMNYGITPDLFSTAKGLAGGLPLGATVVFDKAENVLGAGMHGSTFGGNPVCASAALSILNRLTPQLFDQVKQKSQYVISRLEKCKGVKNVSGLGFMLGIETEKDAKSIALKCIERGVLVLTAKNKVRLLPPLNVSFKTLEKAIDILIDVIEE